MVKLIDGGELAALQEENNRLFIENKTLAGKLSSSEKELAQCCDCRFNFAPNEDGTDGPEPAIKECAYHSQQAAELAATKGGQVTCEAHSWVGDDNCVYCRAESAESRLHPGVVCESCGKAKHADDMHSDICYGCAWLRDSRRLDSGKDLLLEMCSQRLSIETPGHELRYADFEGAYDLLVKTARRLSVLLYPVVERQEIK